MRVAVVGAAGRMGTNVCLAVGSAPDMELVAAIDPGAPRGGAAPGGVAYAADLAAIADSGADVAVDFTVPGAAVPNAEFCAAHGVHVVIGTTGIDGRALARLRAAYPDGGPLGCFVAPNFAVGAVLMMRFAELAAPWFETAEIVELHHDAKVDAPSGTALLTAQRMAEGRAARGSGDWGADPTLSEVLPGARGGEGPAGIRVHSVRLKGLVAHQEVILGTTGETLTIRHDSIDRQSFMPGVLVAVRQVRDRPGVTVGLERLLGLG